MFSRWGGQDEDGKEWGKPDQQIQQLLKIASQTPQPVEIVLNTMRYRSSETVQRPGYFQSSVSYIKVQIMFK